MLLSLLLSWGCQLGQDYIAEKHIKVSDFDMSFHEDENQNIQYFESDITQYTSAELFIYNLLGMLSVGIPIGCFIIAIIITSILVYKNELQKPFAILNDAANHIKNDNLDFTVSYDKENEFHDLCVSFDKMRMALKENYMEAWRQAEERKRINSAFAHDLRTPLTVLKGQSDMLLKYSSQMSAEKISGTADMMKRHIERMETYVETMNSLQRLEDIEIIKNPVFIQSIEEQLQITSASIIKDKELIFDVNLSRSCQVRIDLSAVMQVCENLLVNASRYAKSKILMSIDVQDDIFMIEVSDDGNGFTDKELLYATRPFYKSDTKTQSDHLGMGLHICEIICEKHGGYLKLQNDNGAKITAAFQM